MKQEPIRATNDSLETIVESEIERLGLGANLNHIDVSAVTNMHALFKDSEFNGDISKWKVQNVTDMSNMFENSAFRGDISRWNTQNVRTFKEMFRNSVWDGNLSKWNVWNVEDITGMFRDAKFTGAFSNFDKWYLYNLEKFDYLFEGCAQKKFQFAKAVMQQQYFYIRKDNPAWKEVDDLAKRMVPLYNAIVDCHEQELREHDYCVMRLADLNKKLAEEYAGAFKSIPAKFAQQLVRHVTSRIRKHYRFERMPKHLQYERTQYGADYSLPRVMKKFNDRSPICLNNQCLHVGAFYKDGNLYTTQIEHPIVENFPIEPHRVTQVFIHKTGDTYECVAYYRLHRIMNGREKFNKVVRSSTPLLINLKKPSNIVFSQTKKES